MTVEKPTEERAKTMYFSKFALSHKDAMRVLQGGKVLGGGSEGWRNIAEHCLLAGVTAYTLAELVGLPQADIEEVTHAALIHDWDKRLEKEVARRGADKVLAGEVLVDYDPKIVAKQKETKMGLVRVTGADWRDIDTWGIKEKILRYIDSSLGSTKNGHADFQEWRLRLENLGKRHPQINKEQGERLYGMPLYDKLAEVTERIEKELYDDVIRNNPSLSANFPSPSNLPALIEGALQRDITEKRKS